MDMWPSSHLPAFSHSFFHMPHVFNTIRVIIARFLCRPGDPTTRRQIPILLTRPQTHLSTTATSPPTTAQPCNQLPLTSYLASEILRISTPRRIPPHPPHPQLSRRTQRIIMDLGCARFRHSHSTSPHSEFCCTKLITFSVNRKTLLLGYRLEFGFDYHYPMDKPDRVGVGTVIILIL
jgi:hypothetical protein